MPAQPERTTDRIPEVLDSKALSKSEPRAYDSQQLFGAGREVVIRHGGRDYRLRRTRLGKLILTA